MMTPTPTPTPSHSSLSLCKNVDESSPKCLEDQSNDTSVPPTINFDCSICLELPHDPVVTMCGHLFCWSCLHRWITIHSVCPVCKACVKDKIIPLYGRGKEGRTFNVPRPPSAQHSYAPVANVPQSAGFQLRSFIPQESESHLSRGGHSTYSVTAASGLFPALFGIHMITSPEYSNSGSSAINAPSRLLAATPQQQRLIAQHESVLYWLLFVLGCFVSVCFLLF